MMFVSLLFIAEDRENISVLSIIFMIYHISHISFLFSIMDVAVAGGFINDVTGLDWELWNRWTDWLLAIMNLTCVAKYSVHEVISFDGSRQFESN